MILSHWKAILECSEFSNVCCMFSWLQVITWVCLNNLPIMIWFGVSRNEVSDALQTCYQGTESQCYSSGGELHFLWWILSNAPLSKKKEKSNTASFGTKQRWRNAKQEIHDTLKLLLHQTLISCLYSQDVSLKVMVKEPAWSLLYKPEHWYWPLPEEIIAYYDQLSVLTQNNRHTNIYLI